jgi:CheY-like chemotaxis protein
VSEDFNFLFTRFLSVIFIPVEWVPEGLPGVHITVPSDQATLLDDPRAGAIRVSVTDSGAGLSPDQLAAICSEGVQFNANQLQAGQGSGLGLFISKGLAEQHGGSLTVTSAGLGRGATFTLELPLFRLQDGQAPSAQNSDKAVGISLRGAPASGSNRRVHPGTDVLPQDKLIVEDFDADDPVPKQKLILVVDNADSNRKLLMRILAAKGHLCHGAVNGQDAIDKYVELARQDERVDAVLMDFEMPVMDGPTATQHLRAMGCRSLIVGVTGNVLPQDIDHFKEQGANTVLAKPLNIEAFESTLRGYRPPPRTLGEGTLTANARTSQRAGVVSYSLPALPSSMKLSPAGADENV